MDCHGFFQNPRNDRKVGHFHLHVIAPNVVKQSRGIPTDYNLFGEEVAVVFELAKTTNAGGG